MTKEEDYGTPVTLDELVGHYEMHFMAPHMFRDLLEAYTHSIQKT